MTNPGNLGYRYIVDTKIIKLYMVCPSYLSLSITWICKATIVKSHSNSYGTKYFKLYKSIVTRIIILLH